MSIPRRLVASILLFVAGCGDAVPRYRQKTAESWAADVWSPSNEDATRAITAIREFALTHPTEVTEALADQLIHPRPAATATPFSIRLDEKAATKLGLETMAPADALGADLLLLRRRITDAGIELGSLHGDAKGNVDVILVGGRIRSEAERVQRFICRRGALDLRAVLVAPAEPEAAAKEFATWFDEERRRFEAAERDGTAYRPSRPDRRVVLDPTDLGLATPESLRGPVSGPLALEEPTNDDDAIDERIVESAKGEVGPDGRGRVRVVARPERRAALARWTRTRIGREVAVLRDGVVAQRLAIQSPWTIGFDLRAFGEPGDPPNEARKAREDAATIANGRIPRPLEPVPIPEKLGTDPAPANPVSRSLAMLGTMSVPALERVLKSGAAAWSKQSATWALTEIRKAEALAPK